jgi:hypothetical protein
MVNGEWWISTVYFFGGKGVIELVEKYPDATLAEYCE